MLKTGIKFSINAVVAGQKSSILNAQPQLIVKSTSGQFTITSPVSKALGIAAGENVMFLNNISGIEAAIQEPSQDLLDFAAENGIDINTREGADEIVKKLTVWYIAKGVLLYKKNGEKILSTVRVTRDDKIAQIAENGLAMIQAMSEEEKTAFAASKNLDGADDETLAGALTADDISSPTFHAASGSKTAANSRATGIGLQLSFTDTAIWEALKADLSDKTSVVRYFDVLLDEAEEVPYDNGKETVTVMAYPIDFVEDKKPITRGKGSDNDSEEEAEA